MAEELSLAQAELIGLIVHSCLFGIYTLLFVQSLPFSMDDNFTFRLRKTNNILFAANFSLFLLIFSHWVVQIHRSQKAFIWTAGEPGDPATIFYAFPADPLNLLKESLYLAQTFIGDCTMIYRLWVVYNKNYYITIVPTMVMIVYLVSAIAVVVALARTVPGEDIFISTAGRWAIMVFTTTVATNVLTTSLITYRVWRIQKRVHGSSYGSNVLSVLHIMIESAALYTITAILTLIGYSTKMTWQFITIDMISPIIGISFTLISVRVNRHNSINESTQHSSNVVRIRQDTRREEIGLGNLSVTVSQQVTKHTDLEVDYPSKDEESLDRSQDHMKRGF
ncbi:hypothetical protein K435DRAFT_396032 [Dendrothele bispora CBS 962.96]|uniref:Uncharacterized protein n=1 Tax=Dendrothele bispora (strain CBS 962.96) TaxID=1314807 RepID=A0A4S8L8A8_DENBC|nr:hypothetical protein K435DRAFT_396032 [Dendrothele bispora CBS 962.96]